MHPRILAAVAGVALVASACGDSDETENVDNTAVDGVAEVPLLVEMEIEEALAEIERAGLVAEITPVWVPPSDPRLGIVITQSPDPFGWLPEGSVIQISVGE